MSAKSVPSMITKKSILLCGSLAIATAMEVNKKDTANLPAALSTRTTTTKMFATTMTWEAVA